MSIDILIPCNNPNKSLLKSVISLQGIKEINKIIIINDTFFMDQFIYKYIKENFNKISIIENKYSPGIAGALNSGLDFSTSRYIARIDSGDLCLIKDRFKFIINLLEKKGKVDIICTGIIDQNKCKITPKFNFINGILTPFSRVPHPTWVIKRKSIKCKYNEKLIRFEDYGFLIENNFKIIELKQFDIVYDTKTLLNRNFEIIVSIKKVLYFIRKANFHILAIFTGLSYLILRIIRLLISRKKIIF